MALVTGRAGIRVKKIAPLWRADGTIHQSYFLFHLESQKVLRNLTRPTYSLEVMERIVSLK
jgi:hypothetical protein